MLDRDEILKWLDAFDIQKFPTSVYEELVIEQRRYPGRIEILGAWKTGCLRIDDSGREYEDKNGVRYSFTKRWNPESPVGCSTWIEISGAEGKIERQIPREFLTSKPSIVSELESKEGFGFI